MQELDSTELLYVFVERGLESTLERSTIAREHMGQLLHQLVKAGVLPTAQYYKGWVLVGSLEAEDGARRHESPSKFDKVKSPVLPPGSTRSWRWPKTSPSTSPTSGCTWPS